MKNVMVYIKSVQRSQNEEDGVIEFATEGNIYVKNGSLYLMYKESALSGMEGNTTTLKITSDSVIMKRFGDSESTIEYKKDYKCETLYNTPYGVFNLEIDTKSIVIEIEDLTGKLLIEYEMKIQNLMASFNTLEINFR